MEMILLNSLMVILLCSNGFLAGTLITIFIMRKGFSKYIGDKERTIRMQKTLIKQMQDEGKVKVEVTRANEDIDFPKG